MNVLFDHNLSPALARALQVLFKKEHNIVALRDKFPSNVSDVEWIEGLSKDGSWIVVSGDRRITKNKAERTAFSNSKLVGFFLSKGLYKAKVTKQMERILALWDGIELLSKTVQGGAMFELPMKSSKIKQLKN